MKRTAHYCCSYYYVLSIWNNVEMKKDRNTSVKFIIRVDCKSSSRHTVRDIIYKNLYNRLYWGMLSRTWTIYIVTEVKCSLLWRKVFPIYWTNCGISFFYHFYKVYPGKVSRILFGLDRDSNRLESRIGCVLLTPSHQYCSHSLERSSCIVYKMREDEGLPVGFP